MKVTRPRLLRLSLTILALMTIELESAAAAGEVDVYGDSKLHSVEQEIVKLAEASEKDVSYQEHQQILDKVSEKIVGSITDVDQLATLAIWATLNAHSNEFDGKFINYNDVIGAAFSAAVFKIGRSATPQPNQHCGKVAHQANIDGHISEELCESMSQITKKNFLFGDRVYVRFQDSAFQKLPMPPQYAAFRVTLCEETWKRWKAPVAESVGVIAKASFVDRFGSPIHKHQSSSHLLWQRKKSNACYSV